MIEIYTSIWIQHKSAYIIFFFFSHQVQALTNMTDDCKRHFRQKVRDIMIKLIRKFGTDVITGMVPVSDQIMHKRLKNIRKIETRKQKLKEQTNNKKNDESDEEFNVKRKPKRYTVYILLRHSCDDARNTHTCFLVVWRKYWLTVMKNSMILMTKSRARPISLNRKRKHGSEKVKIILLI